MTPDMQFPLDGPFGTSRHHETPPLRPELSAGAGLRLGWPETCGAHAFGLLDGFPRRQGDVEIAKENKTDDHFGRLRAR